jgi:hypothetical protein
VTGAGSKTDSAIARAFARQKECGSSGFAASGLRCRPGSPHLPDDQPISSHAPLATNRDFFRRRGCARNERFCKKLIALH